MRSVWLRYLIPCAALLALMAAFFAWYDPYTPVGPPLVACPDFRSPDCLGTNGDWTTRRGDVAWEPAGGAEGGPAVRLRAAGAAGAAIALAVPVRPAWTHVRCSTRARFDGVVEGRHAWDAARVLFFTSDAAGQCRWDVPHTLDRVVGSRGWRTRERVFRIPPLTADVHVRVSHTGVAGVMRVDRLQAQPLCAKAAARLWRGATAVLWWGAACAVAAGSGLWRLPRGRLVLLIAAALAVGVTLSQDALARTAERVLPRSRPAPVAAPAVPGPAPAPAPVPASSAGPVDERDQHIVGILKPIAHYVGYAGLSVAALGVWRRRAGAGGAGRLAGLATVGTCLALYGAGTEILQYSTLSRTPGVADWLLDMAGAGTGGLVYGAIVWRMRGAGPMTGRGGVAASS